MTLFEGNLPQKQQRKREREREQKKRERKNERERGREQQKNTAGWMPNEQETGHHRLNFPHRFLPVL
jgi:septal ring factor EnvC (AmiA/AmiB activator)